MNELQINVELKAGSIITNMSELKEQLSTKMAEYKNAVFTEESKQIAKAELAGLRKLSSAVDKRRKEIKVQSMIPYNQFEAEVKELIAIIDEPIQLIDSQLKEMEVLRVQKRKEDVRKLYDEIVNDGAEYLPFEQVYMDKWDNASTTLKSIEKDLNELMDKTTSDIAIIQNSASDVWEEALERYKHDRDLTKALTYINNYEANKKRALEIEEEKRKKEEEHRRQEEIERVRAEERKRLEELERVRAEERAKVKQTVGESDQEKKPPFFEDVDEGNLPFTQPTTITAFYRVVATPEELDRVETAFNSIGIYFERRDS